MGIGALCMEALCMGTTCMGAELWCHRVVRMPAGGMLHNGKAACTLPHDVPRHARRGKPACYATARHGETRSLPHAMYQMPYEYMVDTSTATTCTLVSWAVHIPHGMGSGARPSIRFTCPGTPSPYMPVMHAPLPCVPYGPSCPCCLSSSCI